MGNFMGVAYAAGAPITTAYLIWQDAQQPTEFWQWLLFIPIDMFLGTIWPIYWGILHWIA